MFPKSLRDFGEKAAWLSRQSGVRESPISSVLTKIEVTEGRKFYKKNSECTIKKYPF
jgi:hypothetical protein